MSKKGGQEKMEETNFQNEMAATEQQPTDVPADVTATEQKPDEKWFNLEGAECSKSMFIREQFTGY
jgi:hypothetical protein